MNRKSTLPVALAIMVAVGAASATGVVAQESEGATEGADAIMVSPGPLGRSFADWAGDWQRWWLINLPTSDDIDCALGDQGAVFFAPGAPGSEVDCTIRADQHIMVAIAANVCDTDEGLAAKAEKASGKQGKKPRQRVLADRAGTYECMIDGRSGNRDSSLTLDGVQILSDESNFTLSTPFVLEKSDDVQLRDFFPERGSYISSGYFAMLKPLDPGTHTIMAEVTFPAGTQPEGFSYALNVEVVEAAAE